MAGKFSAVKEKSFRGARQGMQAKDGSRDNAKCSESTGDQLREVVAGDIFHHFAAAAGERAIRKSDGDADDEVPERAKAQAQGAAVVGRENTADGGAFGPQAVEGQPLAMLRQCILQRLQSAACFDRDRQIGPGVFDDSIEPRGGEDEIRFLGWISPIEFRCATARDNRDSGFVRE